jgi:hypothetical protein
MLTVSPSTVPFVIIGAVWLQLSGGEFAELALLACFVTAAIRGLWRI